MAQFTHCTLCMYMYVYVRKSFFFKFFLFAGDKRFKKDQEGGKEKNRVKVSGFRNNSREKKRKEKQDVQRKYERNGGLKKYIEAGCLGLYYSFTLYLILISKVIFLEHGVHPKTRIYVEPLILI